MRCAHLALTLGLALAFGLGGCTTPTPDSLPEAAEGGIRGLPGSERRTVPANRGTGAGPVVWSAEQSVKAAPVAVPAAPPPPAEPAVAAEADAPKRKPFSLFGLGTPRPAAEAAPAAAAPAPAAVAPPAVAPAPEVEPAPQAAPETTPAQPARKPLFGLFGAGKRKAAEAPALDADGNPVQSATLDILPAGTAAQDAEEAGASGSDPAEEAAEATPPETAPAAAPVPVAEQTPAQRACARKGGTISRLNGATLCVQTTRDAGKSCRSGKDCQGQCLARSRTCAPVTPLLGCNDILQDNGVRTTLCIE